MVRAPHEVGIAARPFYTCKSFADSEAFLRVCGTNRMIGPLPPRVSDFAQSREQSRRSERAPGSDPAGSQRGARLSARFPERLLELGSSIKD